jgi:hypothetical protein
MYAMLAIARLVLFCLEVKAVVDPEIPQSCALNVSTLQFCP